MHCDKIHILVQLTEHKGKDLISRSEAKQLLLNLEKAHLITLDFKGVKSVGQGFVDEIFRVFKNYHPSIQIDYKNANLNIEFMIERGLS